MNRAKLAVVVCLMGAGFLQYAACAGTDGSEPASKSAKKHFELGKSLSQDGKHKQAIEEFTIAIEIESSYQSAYALRGDSYRMDNQYELAVKDFTKALSLNSKDEWSLARRAEAYRKLEKYDLALADLDRAGAMAPKDDWAIAIRAEVYRNKEDYKRGIEEFTKALEIDPNDAWDISHRGDCYRMLDQYEAAIKDFNAALELSPKDAFTLCRRGESYRMLGKFDLAILDFNKALESSPDESFAFASRGQTYKQMKDYTRALADFNKAIKIDPDYKWAKARREELYTAMAEGPGISSPAASPAEGQLPLITVLDLKVENIAASDAKLIVDLLSSALIKTKKFRVLDRSQRENLLKEIEFSASECADESCQLKLGKMLAADKIVVGSLGKVGGRFILNVKLLKVQSGEAVASSYDVFKSLDELVDGCADVAIELSKS